MPEDAQQSGGAGGESNIVRNRELRLERRALLHGWPVTPEERKAMILRQIQHALDPETAPRDARLATKLVLEAEVINLGLRRLDLQEEIAARKEAGATERIGLSAIVKALAEQAKEGPKVIEAQEQCQEGNAAGGEGKEA